MFTNSFVIYILLYRHLICGRIPFLDYYFTTKVDSKSLTAEVITSIYFIYLLCQSRFRDWVAKEVPLFCSSVSPQGRKRYTVQFDVNEMSAIAVLDNSMSGTRKVWKSSNICKMWCNPFPMKNKLPNCPNLSFNCSSWLAKRKT